MKIDIYNNHVALVLETFESASYIGTDGTSLIFKHNNLAIYKTSTEDIEVVPDQVLSDSYVYRKNKPSVKWLNKETQEHVLTLQMYKKEMKEVDSGVVFERKTFGFILNKLSKYFTINPSNFHLRSAGVLKKNEKIRDLLGDSARLLEAANTITDNVSVQNYLYYHYHLSLGLKGKDAMFNPSSFGYCIKEGRVKPNFHFSYHSIHPEAGDKRMFSRRHDSRTMQVNIGLLRTVIVYIQKHYAADLINITDHRVNKTYVRSDREYTFGDKTLWDYQKDAVDFILDTLEDVDSLGDLFSCINSTLATNSGKTLMLLALAYNLYDPVVIIPCHTDLLFSKTVADYLELGVEVSCICSYNSKRQAIKYLKNEGIEEVPLWNTLGKFCVVMLPTFVPRLLKGEYSSEQLNKYNIGIFDECEDIIQKSSKNYNKFIEHLNLYYRIASSGSSKDIKNIEKRFEIMAEFGKSRYTITNQDNIGRGNSLAGEFEMQLFSSHPSASTDDLLLNKRRLQLAIDFIRNRDLKHTLFYVGRNKAVIIQELAEELRLEFPELRIDTLTGYTKERSEVLKRLNAGETNIFITSSVVARGLNFSIVDSVINYNPRVGAENTLQALYGRPMRLHEGMDRYYGLDIFDTTDKHRKFSYERYQLHLDPRHGCTLTVTPELQEYLNTKY